MQNVIINYKALLESTQTQMKSMTRDQNARILSRIGFVTQEMKDFQFEINNAIQNRAIEINNNNAECIVNAYEGLDASVVTAGELIMYEAYRYVDLNDYFAEFFMFETTDEVFSLVSQSELELINLFSNSNSVINMPDLVLQYQNKIEILSRDFEYFIYFIYIDMFVYNLFMNDMNRRAFIELNQGLQAFRAEGNSIISSLSECND